MTAQRTLDEIQSDLRSQGGLDGPSAAPPSAISRTASDVSRPIEGDLQTEQHRGSLRREEHDGRSVPAASTDRTFYLAEKQPDGTYTVTLTEEGLVAFETALGIADDLGGKSRISPYSTIADIMDRTATREELSELLRRDDHSLLRSVRILVLRRKLRGSENPSSYQRMIGHLGKVAIIVAIAVWAIMQFGTAIGDIEAIPGILANLPNDLLNLHPTQAFSQVGDKISDAGYHVLLFALGICLTYLVTLAIRPFARIYRKDQIIVGERFTLRSVNGTLRMADKRARADRKGSAAATTAGLSRPAGGSPGPG